MVAEESSDEEEGIDEEDGSDDTRSDTGKDSSSSESEYEGGSEEREKTSGPRKNMYKRMDGSALLCIGILIVLLMNTVNDL